MSTLQKTNRKKEQAVVSSREFYKENENDVIWWVDNTDQVGLWEFSFDKKEIFNLFRDYPYALTPEQKAIFDRENPYWADFFKYR